VCGNCVECTINVCPISDYHNAYNETDVTTSSSKTSAIYTTLTVKLRGDFLWRYSQLWPRELTVKVYRWHAVGKTPLYKRSVRRTGCYIQNT